METECNALFCIRGRHDGAEHYDVTGYVWTEVTPDAPVIAHIYSVTEDDAS